MTGVHVKNIKRCVIQGKQSPGNQEIGKSENQEIRKSGNQEIRKSGNQENRKSGNQENRKSGNQEIRKSGNQEIRKFILDHLPNQKNINFIAINKANSYLITSQITKISTLLQ